MINNKYLDTLYSYNDRDLSLTELIRYMREDEDNLLASLVNYDLDLDDCTESEIEFLLEVNGIIQYFLKRNNTEKPNWLSDERLSFNNESLYYNPCVI